MKLLSSEVEQLISMYQSDLGTLNDRKKETQSKLTELKALLKKVVKEEKAAMKAEKSQKKTTTKKVAKVVKKKSGRGRPAGAKNKTKTTAVKTSKRKVGRPASTSKKKTATKSKSSEVKQTRTRKMSEWDELIVGAIKRKKRAIVMSEIMGMATKKANKKDMNITEPQLRAKMAANVQKLLRKDVIVKEPHEGRGFAYNLA